MMVRGRWQKEIVRKLAEQPQGFWPGDMLAKDCKRSEYVGLNNAVRVLARRGIIRIQRVTHAGKGPRRLWVVKGRRKAEVSYARYVYARVPLQGLLAE